MIMKLFRRNKNNEANKKKIATTTTTKVVANTTTANNLDQQKLNDLIESLQAVSKNISTIAQTDTVQDAMAYADDETKAKFTKSTFFMKCMHQKRMTVQDVAPTIEQYPEICSEQDRWGCTVLAYILGNDPLLETVQYIVQKYPKAIELGNLGNVMYPIHKAVHYKASYQVIQYLLDQWPAGARTFTSKKMLPLHYAVSNPNEPKLIEVLLNAYPAAASIPIPAGNELPLFKACFNQANIDVIKLLVKSYPKAVSTQSGQGSHPVTALCANKDASIESIKYLMKLSPESIRVLDQFGGLPVHYACFKGCDIKIVRLLVESYPAGINLRTCQRKTCHDLAVEGGHHEVSLYLKEARREFIDVYL